MPNYSTVLGPAVLGPSDRNWPGSAQGFPDPAADIRQQASDYPVQASDGTLVNVRTGKPWNGKDPFTGKPVKAGRYVEETSPPPLTQIGVEVPGSGGQRIDPNNPSQRYQAIDIPKDPQVAGAASDLLKTFKTDADAALKDFESHMADYNTSLKSAIASSRSALDIAPVSAALRGQQSKYSNTLDDISKQYAGLNADAIARERGLVTELRGTTPMYDAAVNRLGDIATGNITARVSRDQARSGLPIGSDLARATASGIATALSPLELAKIQNRQGIITGTALPEEQRITGLETQRIGQFLPGIAGSQFQSARDVELGIQNLKQAAAQGNWQLVMQMVQVPEIAAQIRQRLQMGDVQLLGALSQIRDSATYRGLQDRLGANLLQPQYFPQTQPGFPAPPGARPGFVPGRPLPAQSPLATTGNAPVTVSPDGTIQYSSNPTRGIAYSNIDALYKAQTGYWPDQDPNFSPQAYQAIMAQIAANPGTPAIASAPLTNAPTYTGDVNIPEEIYG